MERHEKSWCHGLPWKLTEYTGISRWKSHNTPRPRKHYFGDISVSPEGGIGSRAALAKKIRKRLPHQTTRGMSWNNAEHHDVMVCRGSSLNILYIIEYLGTSWNGILIVVISCIAESPKTPLGLSRTTLGIFLYRRQGASAPEPPLPQKLDKDRPCQQETR